MYLQKISLTPISGHKNSPIFTDQGGGNINQIHYSIPFCFSPKADYMKTMFNIHLLN